MDIYAANIIDHYRHPRNWGMVKAPHATGQMENSSCGDRIAVSIRLEGEVISELKFEGQGCAISQAAISILTGALVGRKLAEVAGWGVVEIEKLLGIDISPRRHDCALLGIRAVQRALKEPAKNAIIK